MNGTLEMINRMQADGVIGKYAIGGAEEVLSPAAAIGGWTQEGSPS
jgi:hypothetical protein